MMPGKSLGWSRLGDGFNPCCIGLDNDARRIAKGRSRKAGFNPCCIGLDNDAGLVAPMQHLEFQSLLYWIGQ